MSNPLRLSALVQGYPVRPPWSPQTAGSLKIWLDPSASDGLLDSSNNATTVSSPAKAKNFAGTTDPWTLTNCTRQGTGKNGLATLRLASGSSVVACPTSSSLDDWSFLHTEPWHGFWVFSSPDKPTGVPDFNREVALLETNSGAATTNRGVYVAALHAVSYTYARLRVAITRAVSGSYVANYTATESLPAGYTLIHAECDPSLAAADRVMLTINGSNYSGNTSSSSVATGSPSIRPRLAGKTDSSGSAALAEMLIYSGSLTEASIADMKTYLRTKWAVT